MTANLLTKLRLELDNEGITYKKASAAAEQQLKQLRRKAVIIVNDDRYKL